MHERTSSVTQHKASGGRVDCSARPRGFTLIDVLVTMAVIAVLISLLSPSLTTIREAARQVVCRSNVRQMGIGISIYADANRDSIPRSVNAPSGSFNEPWNTMDLRLDAVGSSPGDWDGLGLLARDQILEPAKLYYCPSHHGNNPYVNYSSIWAGGIDSIVGNFQYRAEGPVRTPSDSDPNPRTTTRFSQISPHVALVTDGMRTQEDFNHRIGANVLRAGLSVEWWRDHAGLLVDGLPKDDQMPTSQGMQNAWRRLDDPD